jgi:uncharacterized membrane protein
METNLGFLFDVLMGRHASLRQILALVSVLVLSLVAVFAFLGSGFDQKYSGAYFILMIVSVIGAMGSFILLIVWRSRGDATSIPSSRRQSDDAYAIIKELRSSGMLSVSSSPLCAADWSGVILHNADLRHANFNKTGLEGADLRQADLSGAYLRSARLEGANLSKADLTGANLCYAGLQKANLQQAQLANADLSAADLSGALLEGARLKNTQFDQHTTLPDGRKWTPDTDWTQFGAVVTSKSK